MKNGPFQMIPCKDCGTSFASQYGQRFCSKKCAWESKRLTPSKAVTANVEVRGKDECWLWIGRKDPEGYGKAKVRGKAKRGHRLAWEAHYGPIPVGKFVCHRCDNPPCCNPTHLFLGTPADNMADKIAKGRMRVTRGEANGQSKLSAAEAMEIRDSGIAPRDAAKRFGISRNNVHAIRSGKSWLHLPAAPRPEYPGLNRA